VHEHIRSAFIGRNEAVALFAVKEFDHAILARAALSIGRTRRARPETALLATETTTGLSAEAAAFITKRPARTISAIVRRGGTKTAAAKIALWPATAAAAEAAAITSATKPTTIAAAETAAITATKTTAVATAETATITAAEAAIVTAAETATITTAETASAALAATTAAEPTILHSKSLSRGEPPLNQCVCLEALASYKTDSWVGRTIIGTECARTLIYGCADRLAQVPNHRRLLL
jgi:hypothetical protein